MKSSSNRKALSFSLLTRTGLLAATVLLVGCEKNEPPPPLPAANTAAAPKVQKLEIPDAGSEKEEEVEKKATGTGKRAAGALASCCAALRQNAANAPPETQGHMLTAAAACDAANKSAVGAAGFVGTLSGLLRGAGIPSACR